MKIILTNGYPYPPIDSTHPQYNDVCEQAGEFTFTLYGVVGFEMKHTRTVEFATEEQCRNAQKLTGWNEWGPRALEVPTVDGTGYEYPGYVVNVPYRGDGVQAPRTEYCGIQLQPDDRVWNAKAVQTDFAAIEDRVHANLEAMAGVPLAEQESQALRRILNFLDGAGWVMKAADDGEGWEKCLTVEDAVEVAGSVSESYLLLRHEPTGNTGDMQIVRGNSPIELISDHSVAHGFDCVVDAALRHVFPNYPEE